MADPLSQDQRQGKLTTPLGRDVLALMRFSAIEGLSELFEIRVEAVSTQASLDFASALGLGSTITFKTQDDKKRYFHGVMTEARWAGTRGGSLCLPARAEAVALAAHADLGLQDLRAEVADRHHQAGLLRSRLLRFPRRDHRLAADARILRAVPRDGFQFRLPPDGGVRDLLFLRACRRKAHARARRREVEPSSRSPAFRPCPTTRSTTADGENSNISRPGRSGAGRRAASSFSRTTATRNRPPTCSRRRRSPGGYAARFDGDVRLSLRLRRHGGQGSRRQGRRRQVHEIQARGRPVARQAPLVDGRRAVAVSRRADHARDAIRKAARTGNISITHCTHDFEGQTYRSGGGAGLGYVGNYEMTPSDRPFRAPLVTRKPEIVGYQSALVIKDKGRPGDRRRQARPDPRAVLLGPQEEAVAQGPRRSDLGGKKSRRAVHAARRRRGLDRLRGGRSRPADRHRLGLQRDQHRADDAARQEGQVGHPHPVQHRRRRLQHAAVRRHEGRRERQAAHAEGPQVQGAQRPGDQHRQRPRPTRSATTSTRPSARTTRSTSARNTPDRRIARSC